jgi:hypothetical protein
LSGKTDEFSQKEENEGGRNVNRIAMRFMLFVVAISIANAQGLVEKQETYVISGESGNAVWMQEGNAGVAEEADAGVRVMTAQAPVVDFISAAPVSMGPVVKDAPYSATAVTETTRVLSDGTKIENRNASQIYRDSEGRERRENTIKSFGRWQNEKDGERKSIVIRDPVANTTFVLNPQSQTAKQLRTGHSRLTGLQAGGRKVIQLRTRSSEEPAEISGETTRILKRMKSETATAGDRTTAVFVGEASASKGVALPRVSRFFVRGQGSDVQKTDLGEREIDGIRATGTRFTSTIPTGEIGNDRPIVSTTEEWYSPDLQITLLRVTRDPQFGETVYRLEGLSRQEPLKSLFELPGGYQIQEAEQILHRIERAKPAAAKEKDL